MAESPDGRGAQQGVSVAGRLCTREGGCTRGGCQGGSRGRRGQISRVELPFHCPNSAALTEVPLRHRIGHDVEFQRHEDLGCPEEGRRGEEADSRRPGSSGVGAAVHTAGGSVEGKRISMNIRFPAPSRDKDSFCTANSRYAWACIARSDVRAKHAGYSADSGGVLLHLADEDAADECRKVEGHDPDPGELHADGGHDDARALVQAPA